MNPLYDFVSDLKNRIAKGEISGYTALDLFYQHVSSCVIGDGFPDSCEGEPVATIAPAVAISPDPVPEPASEEPADGQTAVADSD